MRPAALRPLVHAGLLPLALLAPLLGSWGMAGVAGAAVLVNAFVLPATPFGRSLRREGEGRWNGLVTYPLAVAVGHALFAPSAASLAWAVLALGDPAAALVGGDRPWKARIPWNRRKSVAGSAAFLLAAAVGGFAVLCALQAIAGRTLGRDELLLFAALAPAAALVGALAESLPLPLDDNLPVLLAAGGAVTWMVRDL